MSFGNFKMFNGIQEALFLALMLVTIMAIYLDIDLTYKIGIAVLSFTVIFLSSLAFAILKQQKEIRQKQLKQA